jgi:hypothetical protein
MRISRGSTSTAKSAGASPADPTKHHFDSKFEIKTMVHKRAEWREKLAAAR